MTAQIEEQIAKKNALKDALHKGEMTFKEFKEQLEKIIPTERGE